VWITTRRDGLKIGGAQKGRGNPKNKARNAWTFMVRHVGEKLCGGKGGGQGSAVRGGSAGGGGFAE